MIYLTKIENFIFNAINIFKPTLRYASLNAASVHLRVPFCVDNLHGFVRLYYLLLKFRLYRKLHRDLIFFLCELRLLQA